MSSRAKRVGLLGAAAGVVAAGAAVVLAVDRSIEPPTAVTPMRWPRSRSRRSIEVDASSPTTVSGCTTRRSARSMRR